MKIEADAKQSAESGIPTYLVSEEDRNVSHLIPVDALEAKTPKTPHGHIAFNALRTYLGIETVEPPEDLAGMF